MKRRGTASLAASPVLIGAVTVLITIVAVFVAYNANQGLPFLPTYDLKAELPSGAKLVAGNDVRIGGFRVGVVSSLEPKLVTVDGRSRAVALVDLKLDRSVQPLAADTTVRVRPRSALGLKYVQLTPGHSGRELEAGDTIPLRNASQPLEIEDVLSTFNDPTRRSVQEALAGGGDALAGRGVALNASIAALNPFLRYLNPVMANLARPSTRLSVLFRELGGTVAQVAPVAEAQAELFTNGAITFAALNQDPAALRQSLEQSPPTLAVGILSFPAQGPFLDDLTDLSRRLQPAAAALPAALPKLSAAVGVGEDTLPLTVPFNHQLAGTFQAADDLFNDPSTLLTLKDLRTTLAVSRPALQYVSPYQTVCNYLDYFANRLGSHQSGTKASVPGGTTQQQGAKLGFSNQPNSLISTVSSRPWDIPPLGRRPTGWNGSGPRGATFDGVAAGRLFGQPYGPAIDAQGNADCQLGQNGYPTGPLNDSGYRYGPGLVPGTSIPTGGNFTITKNNTPGLAGGTYVTRKLGIRNLKDVP